MSPTDGLTESAADFTSQFTSQFSDTEQQILALYDQLERLKLECSFLEAQNRVGVSGQVSEPVSDETLKTAENELLESQALYSLRNNMVESIFTANPVLKAVHAGQKASLVERDLRPHIQLRDELSISLSKVSSTLASTVEETRKVEGEHIVLAHKNVELTKVMLALAEEASTHTKEDVTDPDVRAEIDELEEAVRESRQRWRIMKSTTSAAIAGSGVDWVQDLTLRELVLDDDDDDE